jgi:hypothetical protein
VGERTKVGVLIFLFVRAPKLELAKFSLFVWLVFICSERKVPLAGCWWLVCSERKVLLAGG